MFHLARLKFQPMGIRHHGFDLDSDIRNRLPSPLHILFETSSKQFFESWMDVCRKRSQIRVTSENRCDDLSDTVSLKRLTSRQHFIQNRPERKDIAAGISIEAFRLFGRHVWRRSENHAGVSSEAGQSRRAHEVPRYAGGKRFRK